MSSSRMDLCNCFAARQAARHLTRFYESHLAAAGLTSAQFSILVLLDENHGMTMSAVAQAMVMDRTTLLRALKPLQRDALVQSKRQDARRGDSRAHVLGLLPAGKQRLEAAAGLWAAAQSEFERSVGAARAAQLRSDLRALSRA